MPTALPRSVPERADGACGPGHRVSRVEPCRDFGAGAWLRSSEARFQIEVPVEESRESPGKQRQADFRVHGKLRSQVLERAAHNTSIAESSKNHRELRNTSHSELRNKNHSEQQKQAWMQWNLQFDRMLLRRDRWSILHGETFSNLFLLPPGGSAELGDLGRSFLWKSPMSTQ